MKTFNHLPNYSNAEGVVTACILIVVLAMGASTLFTAEPSAQQVTAHVATSHVAQANPASQAKKL